MSITICKKSKKIRERMRSHYAHPFWIIASKIARLRVMWGDIKTRRCHQFSKTCFFMARDSLKGRLAPPLMTLETHVFTINSTVLHFFLCIPDRLLINFSITRLQLLLWLVIEMSNKRELNVEARERLNLWSFNYIFIFAPPAHFFGVLERESGGKFMPSLVVERI
jgi:hypothetical protein